MVLKKNFLKKNRDKENDLQIQDQNESLIKSEKNSDKILRKKRLAIQTQYIVDDRYSNQDFLLKFFDGLRFSL